MDFAALRREYESQGLDLPDLAEEPVAQFRKWYEEAVAAGVHEPNAMTLSTVAPDGTPSSRYVLLRGLSDDGMTFFTNSESQKATELAGNPRAALTFGWLALHRQVRVTGAAHRLSDADSDAYFASRPRGSQLGAWASPQSSVLADRAELEQRVVEIDKRFDGVDVPRPAGWGGWTVGFDAVEFWQGRRSRLHDRLRYRRQANGWTIERLAP